MITGFTTNQASVVVAPDMAKVQVAQASVKALAWGEVDLVQVVEPAMRDAPGMVGGIPAAAMVLMDLAMVRVVALARVRVTLDMAETLAPVVVQVLDPVPWGRVMVQACLVMAVILAPVVGLAQVPVQKARGMDRVIQVMANPETREFNRTKQLKKA